MKRSNIDWPVFLPALAILLALCLPMYFIPEECGWVILQIYHFCVHDLGWIYILIAVGSLGFLLWLSFGRYGKVVLGGTAWRMAR